ncbi:MAG TPA: zf-HC2 domain-containing protein [Candidatus Binataceae bacterium]|jgi:anti-sigma factor RsiW|nr:zf-HC2 domain-containing protein [Candidatus Binataceae bacterium]
MAATHPETALVPYLRGELSGAERELVAGHLEQCGQCLEAAESFRSLLADLATQVEELPTPEWNAYRAELRRKLAARNQPRLQWWRPAFEWWRPGFGWAGLAAATAAAVLALWFAVPGFRRSAPPDDQIAMEEQQIDVTDVGLLRNYGVVTRLDLLENYDVIEHLDELRPAPKPSDAVRRS